MKSQIAQVPSVSLRRRFDLCYFGFHLLYIIPFSLFRRLSPGGNDYGLKKVRECPHWRTIAQLTQLSKASTLIVTHYEVGPR